MFLILEIYAFISYIYFKTIVIDNLHLFRKWRGSSPIKLTLWCDLIECMCKKLIHRQCIEINLYGERLYKQSYELEIETVCCFIFQKFGELPK